jgi:hypothetical protein
MSEDKEISEVREQEEQRGKKRPVNVSELRRRMILRRKFKEALEKNDEAGFIESIVNDLGSYPVGLNMRSIGRLPSSFVGGGEFPL